jgi:hypothetical protein
VGPELKNDGEAGRIPGPVAWFFQRFDHMVSVRFDEDES